MAGELLYFAHVPKCAGTSVSDYLTARFGAPAFEDRRYFSSPPKLKWNNTSPQHISMTHFERLFPHGFFDHSISVVRHPESRLRSVFLFQKHCERRIPRFLPFRVWLHSLRSIRHVFPFALDNHLSPAGSLIPHGTRVFRLEDGLDSLVSHVNILSREARAESIGFSNVGPAPGRELSDAECSLIFDLYKDDYEAFGYSKGGVLTSGFVSGSAYE